MTFEEMNRRLREHECREDWLVKIKYKYSFEKQYSSEIRVLQYDAESDNWLWDTDWNEGQTNCFVVWMIPLQDVELDQFEKASIEDEWIRDCIFTLSDMCKHFDECEDCLITRSFGSCILCNHSPERWRSDISGDGEHELIK